ncbi:MAG TPA: hypothetical protein VFG71_11270 [Nitrospiraceae bacterium]|nr:hypothetical protein [Nitrospiraceae bacterium]
MIMLGIMVCMPVIASGKPSGHPIGMENGAFMPVEADDASEHGDFLVAGFGFQTSFSSLITIRTYQAQTGMVLSDDSYDLNVQEDATSGETRHDQIFAGGIGVDAEGQHRFLLRVYDARTGKFLWQGQLNLTSQKEESRARPIATLTPFRSAVWRTGKKELLPIQLNLSLQAVDPLTGMLVWEDRFIPGVSMSSRAERTSFRPVHRSMQIEGIGHIFNLVVRTVDRASGRLLWQDSFEETDSIERAERENGHRLTPQTVPLWNDKDPAVLASTGRPAPAMIGCAAVWNGTYQPIASGICHRTVGACPASPWQGSDGL